MIIAEGQKKVETWHQASAVSVPAYSPSHQQGSRTERKPLVALVVTTSPLPIGIGDGT